MEVHEVLVIGAGIAGCAVALALAKRGIPVTILTSSFDQRTYHASFIQMDHFEEVLDQLQKIPCEQFGCCRASEQLNQLAKKSVEELLELNYLVDKRGNIDIHRSLQEQLSQFSHIKWVPQHSAIELLTLESHSSRPSDVYKKATCLGAYVYNYETHQIEKFLAKETILATGGVTSLFPYSTHTPMVKGNGLAMAYRAGARLLNLDEIQFHPLALFEKEQPCFPLPIDLLKEGGRLYAKRNPFLEGIVLDDRLTYLMYQEVLKSQTEHLWLDLTILDPVKLKDQFPLVDAYCLAHGFNMVKDPLPVLPVAQYTCGGVAVDKVGQTTLHRLRAIGEVACTGLLYDFKDEAIEVLESLTWAVACAEDISKHIPKFVYYFPETRDWEQSIDSHLPIVQEDWKLLRQIMWHYVGIGRDRQRLKRGCSLLEQLKAHQEVEGDQFFSIHQHHLSSAIQVAMLMGQSALDRIKGNREINQLALVG